MKNIAISCGNKVILIDLEGTVVADSSIMGVTMENACGIIYHSQMNMLLVCDKKCIIYLDPIYLKKRKQITVDTETDLIDIGVLHSGKLVTCQSKSSVRIYDTEGQPQSSVWSTYTTETGDDKKLFPVRCINVDNKDNVYVTLRNKVVKFDTTGITLCAWTSGLHLPSSVVYSDMYVGSCSSKMCSSSKVIQCCSLQYRRQS